jgi:hypothetical protein
MIRDKGSSRASISKRGNNVRLGGVLAILMSLPGAAAAATLTIEVWPSIDPNKTIFCAMSLTNGRFSAFELIGHGRTGAPRRWYAIETEILAFGTALQSLIGGDLAGQVILTSRTPQPPYIAATWLANVDDTTATGIYVQSGIALPDVLLQAVVTLLPDGPCARHLVP